MRRLLVAALVLVSGTAANAAEWQYEDGGVPIAYADNGTAQLQFACRGGDLALGYWVRAPHRQVAGAASMSLSITPDAAAASYAQDMPMIHSDGSSVIVRGPVARQWARIAQQARETIGIAYVRHDARGKLEAFDTNAFGADGSAAAIEHVLDRCG